MGMLCMGMLCMGMLCMGMVCMGMVCMGIIMGCALPVNMGIGWGTSVTGICTGIGGGAGV